MQICHTSTGEMRTVSVTDLLGRGDPVVYGAAAARLVAGKRILVTGAGGSIGSEIVRQLHRLEPAIVYLLDHDESALHALQLELAGHGLMDDETIILADIRDESTMRRVLAEIRPHIVYHAAAHKHLPLLERFPAEGVKANVIGTLNVVRASMAAGVERLVNVSTDKAARPTSVLGSTKRLAEMVVTGHAGRGVRVASVRFGNVLGSRGSFLQSLSYQVAHGCAITVTDPAVTRFFMTIPEAAGLVIEASAMADCGETYVLDMGTPVRILDLVHRYLALCGAEAPELRFTGLRPGEKLHEELFDAAESCVSTVHPRIRASLPKQEAQAGLLVRVEQLRRLAVDGRERELRVALAALMPRAGISIADFVDVGAGGIPNPAQVLVA